MNESEKYRKLVYVCVLGIVAVIIFLIFLLYLIWFPNKKDVADTENVVENANSQIVESSADANLGVYKTINRSAKNQVSEYSQRILNLFLSRDIDAIYDFMNKEYISYFNLSKKDIENKLNDKSLLGRQLSVYQYTTAEVNGKNAFLVYIRSNDQMVEDTFIITETSPRNYSISFDNFVFYDTTKKEYIRDGVKYTLYDQLGFINSYSAKLNIANMTDEKVIVNKDHNYEICYLRMSDDKDIRSNDTFVSGETFTLERNGELNAKMSYFIDRLSYSKMKSIVIKGVTINNGTETKEIEIPLN